jgi:polyphenol oxidase
MALRASLLDGPGLSHGFFTRHGGVSSGVYASLNGGVGSKDDPVAVAENRRRMAAYLGIDPARFLVPYQTHSPEAVIVTEAFYGRPRCDALVTATPGLGLGVTGADCGMVLFADAKVRVIAAAHAGWKGALSGVLEATLDAMETLGARRAWIRAVLGPAIAQKSYEVGSEFAATFNAVSKAYGRFFAASPRSGHFQFDLPGFIVMRLEAAGAGAVEDLARDTYAEPDYFFSYRRSVHKNEPDYGRQIAAIALA